MFTLSRPQWSKEQTVWLTEVDASHSLWLSREPSGRSWHICCCMCYLPSFIVCSHFFGRRHPPSGSAEPTDSWKGCWGIDWIISYPDWSWQCCESTTKQICGRVDVDLPTSIAGLSMTAWSWNQDHQVTEDEQAGDQQQCEWEVPPCPPRLSAYSVVWTSTAWSHKDWKNSAGRGFTFMSHHVTKIINWQPGIIWMLVNINLACLESTPMHLCVEGKVAKARASGKILVFIKYLKWWSCAPLRNQHCLLEVRQISSGWPRCCLRWLAASVYSMLTDSTSDHLWGALRNKWSCQVSMVRIYFILYHLHLANYVSVKRQCRNGTHHHH